MKVNKFKKIKKNQYEVEFDNCIKMRLYDDIIVRYNLLSNKHLADDVYLSILKENDSLKAYYISLAYIKRKIRSESEIRDYLSQKEYDLNNIEEVINRLKIENYLNEDNFLLAFIYDRVNLSNDGYYKILNELKKHNFQEEVILKHLDEIDEDIWFKKLDKLITKKIKSNNKYSGNKLKQKISFDLVNLGYTKEMIENIINNYHLKDDYLLEKEFNKVKGKLTKKYFGKELNYQIKNKLIQQGFCIDDINNKLNDIDI